MCARENGGPRGAGISGGTDPECNDSPGHVTAGSHRGTGQSETRGQRVRAACLFHCVCVRCLTAECGRINPETSASTQTGLAEAGQRQQCDSPSLGTDSTAAESSSSSFICLYASSVSGSSCVCFSWQREKGKYVSLFLSLSGPRVLYLLSEVVNPTTSKGTSKNAK